MYKVGGFEIIEFGYFNIYDDQVEVIVVDQLECFYIRFSKKWFVVQFGYQFIYVGLEGCVVFNNKNVYQVVVLFLSVLIIVFILGMFYKFINLCVFFGILLSYFVCWW